MPKNGVWTEVSLKGRGMHRGSCFELKKAKMKKYNQRDYELIYKDKIDLVRSYYLSEEEYFDYYQNSNDPTFQNYPYELEIKIMPSDIVCYYSTALNIFKKGKSLSILKWKDFLQFIIEWSYTENWNSYSINHKNNGGISFITTKTFEKIGEIKCIWITKKYAYHRPVGTKIIRELDYLISCSKASKGIVVTTSRLTKGALDLIRKNKSRMAYIDKSMLEKEFELILNAEIKDNIEFSDELPF
jgi:hypothetical protein